MLVQQLVGRYAGELVEMPFAAAKACLEAGTVRLPEAEPQARRVAPAPQAAAATAPALGAADAPPSLRGRRRRG